MKNKTVYALLAAAGLASSGMAFAAGNASDYYVQGDLGLNVVQAKSSWKDVSSISGLKNSYNKANVLPRLSVGRSFGDVRVAADYTHYPDAKKSADDAKTVTKARGAGVSVIYDIPMDADLKPYVGGRLSVNQVKNETSNKDVFASIKSTRLSPGIMAGVTYPIDNNILVDGGYRYNYLDKTLKSHELSVGVRYNFR